VHNFNYNSITVLTIMMMTMMVMIPTNMSCFTSV